MRDMNWKRGLFRTWLVGTAIWIAAVIYMVVASWPVDLDTSRFTPQVRAHVLLASEWALGPPIAVLIAGLVLGWILRGFRLEA